MADEADESCALFVCLARQVEMKKRRGSVEEELKEVQPMIDEARKAVGQIKKENIDEIRSLKMPPEVSSLKGWKEWSEEEESVKDRALER